MFSRVSFVLLLSLVVSICGEPSPNSSAQGGMENTNCGMTKSERDMLAHIKAKVDFVSYIAEQLNNGNS